MATRDDPKCKHRGYGDSQVLVTNQPHAYDPTRSHRSTWVCTRQECVWDAAGWVMRGTGEKPWWRTGVDGEWRDDTYQNETERVTA
ncbi:hypothetical protein GCM10025773_11990 [Microbacterium jejuense]